MRRSAAPFHQLSNDAVDAGRWRHELNGAPRGEVQAILPDWDYGAGLRLERAIRINWSRAAEDLAIEGQFDLELIVEIGTGRGNMPREIVHIQRVALEHGCGERLVHFVVPSRWLSHQLNVRCSLVLATPGHSSSVLAPREPGSRLWFDRANAGLEGDDPRFPMEVVDFSDQFPGRPHRYAPWFVNWSPAGAHRDFRGAVRLYLNSEHPEFVERVQAQDPMTLQTVMSDVVSQVCEGLLQHSEHAGDLHDCEEGSLADQARHWLERAFGSVEEAKSVLNQRPGEFRAAILASVRLQA